MTIGEDILNETQQRAMRNISARRRKPVEQTIGEQIYQEERNRKFADRMERSLNYFPNLGQEWIDQRKKTEEKYQAGEITDIERGLLNVGGTGGHIDTLISPPLDLMSETDKTLFGGVGGKTLGLIGQSVKDGDMTTLSPALSFFNVGLKEYEKWKEKNSRPAENFEALLNIVGMGGSKRVAQGAINTPAANVKTLLEGFYGAGVGKASKGIAALQGLVEALPSALNNAFNPKTIAYERVTGIPQGKSKDISETQQLKKVLVKEKEGETTYVVDTDGKRHVFNKDKIKQDKLGRNLIEDKDTGKLKRLTTEKKLVDRSKGDRIGASYTAESIAQQRGAKPGTTIIGEGPLGVVDEIAVIQANNTAEVSRQLFSKGVNIGYDVPDAIKKKHLDHVYKVWGFNKDKTDIKIKNPEGPTSQISAEARLGNEKIPKTTPLKALGVKGEVTLIAKKNKPNLKGKGLSEWVKKLDPPVKVEDLKKEHIKRYYGYLNGVLEKAGEKKRFKLEDNDDGFLHISDSHGSREKELGGVNDMISINPESGNIYTTISDQHDMFGINPLGGKGLVAVTPTQKSNFKTDVKFDVEDNLNKKETLAKMEEAADFIEQKYGIPRNKNENAVTYHMRVIGEIDPKANMGDYANAARRAAMATSSTQLLSQEQNY